jgi:hypothetical protein
MTQSEGHNTQFNAYSFIACNFFRQFGLLQVSDDTLLTLLQESTVNRSIAVTMRIKCLLAITAALILIFLLASVAYAVVPWFA